MLLSLTPRIAKTISDAGLTLSMPHIRILRLPGGLTTQVIYLVANNVLKALPNTLLKTPSTMVTKKNRTGQRKPKQFRKHSAAIITDALRPKRMRITLKTHYE